LVCRAALVLLDALDGGLLANVQARGAQLKAGLVALQARYPVVSDVRGRGLILGLRLARGAPELQKQLHRLGLLVNCTAGDVIRIVPPFVITEREVTAGLDLLERGLATTN
jgi:acetylornithine/succinyldiaminopimelate/putrescine aminotransferase